MRQLKVYFPQIYQENKILFEIAEWDSSHNLRLSSLGAGNFIQVFEPENADWIIIPLFLTGLVTEEGRNYVQKSHDLAKSLGKPLALFSDSDLVIDPQVEHYFLFTPGSYASDEKMIELPALLPKDPLQVFFDGEIHPLEKPEKPTLGFCGQATANGLKTLKDFLQIQSLRLKKKSGKVPYLRIPLFLPAFERYKLLSRLEDSTLVSTDFIYRKKYRAGAQTPEDKSRVEKEFYQNIRNNLFTICLRGMGNYSVRFFQTLAMGRIPVLIDTDSRVPFEKFIEEKDFYISIPYAQRNQLDIVLSQFIQNKTSEELENWQTRCRKIWESYYQKDCLMTFLNKEMNFILHEKF